MKHATITLWLPPSHVASSLDGENVRSIRIHMEPTAGSFLSLWLLCRLKHALAPSVSQSVSISSSAIITYNSALLLSRSIFKMVLISGSSLCSILRASLSVTRSISR